jgi:hypothetical protein
VPALIVRQVLASRRELGERLESTEMLVEPLDRVFLGLTGRDQEWPVAAFDK